MANITIVSIEEKWSVTRACNDDELAVLTAQQAVAAQKAADDAAAKTQQNQLLAALQAKAAKNPDLAALMQYLNIPLTGGLP